MIQKIFGKYFKYSLAIIVSLLILSYVAYNFPLVNQIIFGLICLSAIILTAWKLEFGLYLIIGELFIGSKGYLFFLEIGGLAVSLRLALFLIVVAVWLIHFIKVKANPFLHHPLFKTFLVLGGFIVWGVIRGCLAGNSFDNLFFDLNGYLYFGLIFLFIEVIKDRKQINIVLQILAASLVGLVIQSLLLVYIFGHQFIFTMPSLYSWVRDFGIGEITMITENFYRVFFQGQIYALFSLFIFLAIIFGGKKIFPQLKQQIGHLGLLTLSIIIIIVSFSRSFWLGLGGGSLFFLILLWRPFHLPMSIIIKKCLLTLGVVVISVGLVFGIANFPYPEVSTTTSASLIKTRALDDLTSESAAASRWQLLPVLWDKIKSSPILGHGFGTTVTYQTEDLRFLASHPDGLYTTFAFEWTYLDLWIKMGIFGLLIYLVFLFRLAKLGWHSLRNPEPAERFLTFGFLSGLVALIILNLTTPYLNHPLGIGFIMLCLTVFTLFTNKPEPEDA